MLDFFPKKNTLANQLIFAILLCLLVVFTQGTIPGISVALGFVVALLPCLAFQTVFFTNQTKAAPNKIVKNFYLAAALKFVLLISLFIGCAQWSELEVKIFFLAFALMQCMCWGSNLFRLRFKE